jgi:hypothetical protein
VAAIGSDGGRADRAGAARASSTWIRGADSFLLPPRLDLVGGARPSSVGAPLPRRANTANSVWVQAVDCGGTLVERTPRRRRGRRGGRGANPSTSARLLVVDSRPPRFSLRLLLRLASPLRSATGASCRGQCARDAHRSLEAVLFADRVISLSFLHIAFCSMQMQSLRIYMAKRWFMLYSTIYIYIYMGRNTNKITGCVPLILSLVC